MQKREANDTVSRRRVCHRKRLRRIAEESESRDTEKPATHILVQEAARKDERVAGPTIKTKKKHFLTKILLLTNNLINLKNKN